MPLRKHQRSMEQRPSCQRKSPKAAEAAVAGIFNIRSHLHSATPPAMVHLLSLIITNTSLAITIMLPAPTITTIRRTPATTATYPAVTTTATYPTATTTVTRRTPTSTTIHRTLATITISSTPATITCLSPTPTALSPIIPTTRLRATHLILTARLTTLHSSWSKKS